MSHRPFERALAAADLVLTEGSIYERLRRHPEIDYDDQVAHAGRWRVSPHACRRGFAGRCWTSGSTRQPTATGS
jgi:hypothetical protein